LLEFFVTWQASFCHREVFNKEIVNNRAIYSIHWSIELVLPTNDYGIVNGKHQQQ